MRLFISYSRKDMDAANHIAAELRSRGAEVFIDYERLQAGENFPERLALEVENSDAVVFLLSEHSAASKWVRAEFQLAFHHDRPIIPLALDSAEMPRAFFFLMAVERVDFTRWQRDKQVDAATRKLAVSLNLPEQGQPSTPELIPADVAEILPPPFDWCPVPKGLVTLEDASSYDGTKGGSYPVLPFAIAKYPITNAQYQAFVDADDGYRVLNWWDYSPDATIRRMNNPSAQETGFAGDDLPRTNVSWYDAAAFCRWLSDKTGQTITLPTEQQWQRAAQGDDNRQYPWGNEKPDKNRCNFKSKEGQPTPVTQRRTGASPYRVMDMSGNVWEWCLTEWGTDGVNITGNNRRVLRGGSWGDNVYFVRVAYRDGRDPVNQFSSVGFRCARSY